MGRYKILKDTFGAEPKPFDPDAPQPDEGERDPRVVVPLANGLDLVFNTENLSIWLTGPALDVELSPHEAEEAAMALLAASHRAEGV